MSGFALKGILWCIFGWGLLLAILFVVVGYQIIKADLAGYEMRWYRRAGYVALVFLAFALFFAGLEFAYNLLFLLP